MNIVVMGGSFNPPTAAHLKIMQTALDMVKARTGFFIPVSFPYLKRKMMKAGQSHLCLPDDLRIRMLEAMAAADTRIQIYTDGMSDPYSDDAGTMRMIQEKYPYDRIYYIAGADKLDLLDHFAGKGDFFDRFHCILFSRDSKCLIEEIAGHEHLAAHMDSFVPAEPPDGIEGISSTRIREQLFDIDAVVDMLCPEVIPLLQGLKREDFPEEILQFKDEYAFLSNDFPAEVEYVGITYPCVTSGFLASKCEDPAEKKIISGMRLDKAKQKYNASPGAADWEEHKYIIMEEIVRSKFRQHPELMESLKATGDRRLINGGKKDVCWGVNLSTWEGENFLGIILMKIRMGI